MSDQHEKPDDELIQHQRDRPVVPCWMTKREHFASMAMQGLLMNKGFTGSYPEIAIIAVAHADALIDLLEKLEK
jgi:hypothetical protein